MTLPLLLNRLQLQGMLTNLRIILDSTSAFTLDRYAHVTTTMQRESANRMEKFIAGL